MCASAFECIYIYVSMLIFIYKYTNKSPILYLSIRLSAFSLSLNFYFPPFFPFVYLCLSLRPSLLISLLSLPLNHSFSLTFFLFLPLSLPLSLSLFLTLSLALSLSLSLSLSFSPSLPLSLPLPLCLCLSFLLSLFREAILRTNLGDIHIKLFGQECPRTIENFSVRHRDN